MRILIDGAAGMNPVEIRDASAILCATTEGEHGTAPVFAYGPPQELAQLAAIILMSVRRQLGQDVFDRIVRAAVTLGTKGDAMIEDVTDQARRR